MKVKVEEDASSQYVMYRQTDKKLIERIDAALDSIENGTINSRGTRDKNGKSTFFTIVTVPGRSDTYVICWWVEHKKPEVAHVYIIKKL